MYVVDVKCYFERKIIDKGENVERNRCDATLLSVHVGIVLRDLIRIFYEARRKLCTYVVFEIFSVTEFVN